ncbi:carotenoid cleavage dioxygenase 7 [Striga hermonthica]|uniref:Carotenoid cleavage dioxygenase 7 n=1 Tax=Striga hermonthica TaxID=68872 RepID=A0A9N7MZB4_STRHE|nr:carotenoid cleavage dioxygenase 7 [Striga hermonthica]
MLGVKSYHHHYLLPPKSQPPPPSPYSATPTTTNKHTASPRAAISISTAAPTTTPAGNIPAPPDEAVLALSDYRSLFSSQRAETSAPVPLRHVISGGTAAASLLPADFPLGTYYLAGPGMFEDDHGSTVHPLDGHGYLRAFTFLCGAHGQVVVEFAARYVETESRAAERDPATGEWRFTHRGPFSVLRGGGGGNLMAGNTKVMKNVANTSVVRWGGRLLCLWEGGDPYEVEEGTLTTVGNFPEAGGGRSAAAQCDGGGEALTGVDLLDVAANMLKPILYGVFKMPPKRVLSHYKIDALRNRLLIMSCNAEDMLLPRSNFTFYEFDSNFKLLQSQDFCIPDHLMIHDWAFTDSHYILFGNRVKLDVAGSMAAVCGLSPMISALSLNPSKSTTPIYLLPRFPNNSEQPNRPLRDWKIPIESPSQMWVLHMANAFEERGVDGNLEIQIQASSCSYQWFNFQKMFGYDWQSGKLDPSMMNLEQGQEKLLPHLIQVKITLDSHGACKNCQVNDLSQWKKPSDFPVINQDFSGKKNKFVYAATSSGSRRALPHFPFDTVVKLNTTNKSTLTWSTGRRKFIGEPIFIAKRDKKDEDDGYLLVVEYAVSNKKCYLVVLDSKMIGRNNALVARFEVPRHLNFPLGFHGFWAPDVSHSPVNSPVSRPNKELALAC